VTDESGNFSLSIPYQNEEILLRIEKEGYSDSSLYLKRDDLKFLEISLRPEKAMEISISIPKDSNAVNENSNTDTTMVSFVQDSNIVAIDEKSKMFDRILLLINKKMGLHYRNIKDTIIEKMQISFLPGLSTNRLISGNIINKYSFNILGGVSKGVKKLEIGGLFNIDRNNVNNCQLAGLFNIVGGKVNGYQAAGLINIVNDSIKGFQNAGLINITTKQIDGAQIAGLGNISKSAKGVQIAGLYNISKTVNGAQIGGLFNVTHTIKGIQIAGLLNVAKIVNGTQVAGLLNVAQKVKNQIGFINIVDSCSGIPIGFLTIVKNGYHKLEYSADEVFNYNLSFRTGVRRFYNIFGIGSNLANGTNFSWSYTYGVGTSFKLHKKLFLDFDLQCSQLANQGYAQYLSLNNRLNVGLDWQFAKKASLTFGPSFNTYVVDKQNYVNNSFYENTGKSYPNFSYITNGNIDVRSWIGWKVGLRLF
jgi:hypothetical protein